MKLKVYTPKNEAAGEVTLPAQFSEPVRADLIKKAVLTIQRNSRQPYGASPEAGKQHSTYISRRRRKYRGSYGKGISRVPRKILSRSGSQMYWVGAFAPGTVGGRRAHPAKATKIWDAKVNDAERKKAIRSALAAAMDAPTVSDRGHQIPPAYPFCLSNDFEKIAKTSEFATALKALGFDKELARSSKKTVRAGKGTMRGRKYKKTTGPLVVVSTVCEASKAARNIPGINVVAVQNLNAEKLAPGADAGRVTLFTQAAIEKMAEKKLFL